MLFCSMLLASTAWAQDSAGEPGRGSGEPNPLNNVYFGEQHLHTQDSPDAFAMGTRNSQDDAYNFAKGQGHQEIDDSKAMCSAWERPKRISNKHGVSVSGTGWQISQENR